MTGKIIVQLKGKDGRKGAWFLAGGLIIFFLFLSFSWAGAVASPPEVVELVNPLGAQEPDVPFLLGWAGKAIKGFIGLTGAIALLFFVYGGFLWLTSLGSPDKIKKGKDIFVWSVVGLIIIFSSYLLVDFVIRGLTALK
ncbi:MAG: hypothetical protein HY982_02055 [Candidatus Magasanikbacteria bacterium]|nr:hypothetical protein [Candidatus Magasanikbacteria bacterium]